MKILVCAHDSTFTGGANRSLMMVIDGLRKHNDVESIEVILPRKKGTFNDACTKREIKWYHGLYFGATSGIRKDGKDILRIIKVYLDYILENIQALYFAIKLRNKNYDLVYSNSRSILIGAKIARYLKIPHIIHVREFGAEKPLFGFWTHQKVYKYSDKIILISKALYDSYREVVNEDKLVMIHNGIDSPLNIDIQKHNFSKRMNILITGRIVPDKAQLEAIEAIKILKEKQLNNICLYIAGSSPKNMHIDWYLNNLKKYVKENNLEQEVVFLGEVNDMVSLRKDMDIELMCAIKETFGRVTVEGMRSNLLLVGTNTGGTLDIISDQETGYLYQQGDANDLANKLEYIYNHNDEANQIALNGYNYCQNHFTASENIQNVYLTIKDTIR